MVVQSICYAPPIGSTTMLTAVNSVCLAVSVVGVILTQYKSQFYVESDVTQALYYAASLFFWATFLLSLALICFGMMQKKHLARVSADYPEVDLRTGNKSKFLLAMFVLSGLACAAGFGFGGFGFHYMETRREATLQWTLDVPVDLASNGTVLQVSIQQTVEGEPQTWMNIQDRLGCCSWTNVTDQYATGYCCTNADHGCPVDEPVPCRDPWLEEISNFNSQVCTILLIVGASQIFSWIGLLQLRFFSRSSLHKYSAYGASRNEKQDREKAQTAAAFKQITTEATDKVETNKNKNDSVISTIKDEDKQVMNSREEYEEKDINEAEKQPLTGVAVNAGKGV